MKFYKLLLIILIIFLKTGNVLSDTNIFIVNNIEIVKKDGVSNEVLSNLAIKKGFEELINRILLKEDVKKLQELKFSEIKELVSYYQVSNDRNEHNLLKKINFKVSFDKNKIHNLFYKKAISYSDIENKEFLILPILKKNNKLLIYNNNFFYNKWNEISETDLLEFILPLENIEVIQNINFNKNNLFNIKLNDIFLEYGNKNYALVFIEDENNKEEKIYIKSKILEKEIVKNISIKRFNLNQEEFYKKIIIEVKQEILNLVKSKNLIDIRVPAFLNVNFALGNKNNLVELSERLKKIDLIENLYVQKFDNNNVELRIKYLGKLDKIIQQLKDLKILLNVNGDQWSIEII